MKKRIGLGKKLAIVTVIGVAAYIVRLLAVKENKVKVLVMECWNEIKEEVMATLKLKQEPTFEWDNVNKDVSMETGHMETYRLVDYFKKEVIETTPTYVIGINLKNIADVLKTFNLMSLKSSTKTSKTIIKQMLYHECRHIYQAENGFYVGRVSSTISLNMDLLNGYGNSPEELDANEFAVSMTKTRKERAIGELQKKMQEEAIKIMPNEMREEKVAFVKAVNPLLGMFM